MDVFDEDEEEKSSTKLFWTVVIILSTFVVIGIGSSIYWLISWLD